jgi:hypothetical protein
LLSFFCPPPSPPLCLLLFHLAIVSRQSNTWTKNGLARSLVERLGICGADVTHGTELERDVSPVDMVISCAAGFGPGSDGLWGAEHVKPGGKIVFVVSKAGPLAWSNVAVVDRRFVGATCMSWSDATAAAADIKASLGDSISVEIVHPGYRRGNTTSWESRRKHSRILKELCQLQ